MSFVDDLIKRINDTERRLSRIERLDVNPPASSVAKYSGTPVANGIAYWTGAGTVAGGSIAYSNSGTPVLAATSSAGWRLEDDGGNQGILIADGGVTTIASALAVTPTASGVTKITFGASTLFSISPGGITTAQTWTIDITDTNAASRLYHVFDIMIGVGTSAAAQYAYYSARIAFDRVALGATATIRQTSGIISAIEATITFTGPTAIADGVRFTIHPSSNTLNRNGAQINVVPSTGTLTITSTVA